MTTPKKIHFPPPKLQKKSHQKAHQRGFTECWTVVNVGRLNMAKAHSESPSTDRFYSLAALSPRAGDEYDDFRRRVLSLTAIPSAPTKKPQGPCWWAASRL